MARDYPRLDIETFGRHLLESGDLDPIYIALNRLRAEGMEEDQLHRWLIAYWCFYHAGFASYASERESGDFWSVLMIAADNEAAPPVPGRWPRGHERRHFRGALASSSIGELWTTYKGTPEAMVRMITQRAEIRGGELCLEELTVRTVSARAQQHRGFGPWIGFKIADMVDRCLGVPVSFDNAAVFMFDDPTEAALRVWRQKAGLPSTAKPKDKAAAIQQVVDYLTTYFKDYLEPARKDRPVGLQEVETVLCKAKSHANGHYPLNNDIVEIREGCRAWASPSPTAAKFIKAMPEAL